MECCQFLVQGFENEMTRLKTGNLVKMRPQPKVEDEMTRLKTGHSPKINLQPKVMGFDSADHEETSLEGYTFITFKITILCKYIFSFQETELVYRIVRFHLISLYVCFWNIFIVRSSINEKLITLFYETHQIFLLCSWQFDCPFSAGMSSGLRKGALKGCVAVHNTKVRIVRGDITDHKAEALVNSTDEVLRITGTSL